MSKNPDDIYALASDYVLGHLSEQDSHDFEQRLAGDAELRLFVRDMREKLLELDLTASPASLSPDRWEQIAARLSSERPGKIVALRPKRRASDFWKGFAAASIAATVLAAVGVGTFWQTLTVGQPKVIVVLVDQESKPGAIIEAYSDDSVRVIPLENFSVPEGRVIQVWTLPDAETGPVSLGLLDRVTESKLMGPHLPAPKPDQLYEFTLEPEGGSPTGRPTGPILVKGFAKSPPI